MTSRSVVVFEYRAATTIVITRVLRVRNQRKEETAANATTVRVARSNNDVDDTNNTASDV